MMHVLDEEIQSFSSGVEELNKNRSGAVEKCQNDIKKMLLDSPKIKDFRVCC